jgi:membrane protein required for colicin V production
MVLDIIGLCLIALFFIRGYMKGFIVAAFSMLAIVLGVICSLKLSEKMATWLFDKGIITSGWGQVISFVVLFIGVILLVNLIAKALETAVKAAMMGWFNGLMGAVLYTFMAAFMWSAILWLCNQMHLLTPETIAYSKTYKYMVPIAPWVCEKVGILWPMAKDVFADLQVFFSNVNQQMPQHVDTPR